MPAAVVVTLNQDEWALISALREVPDGPLRDALGEVVADLLRFVRFPHCAQMQADGVPCPSVTVACDECRQVMGVLDRLRGVGFTEAP